ncbi:hypothetical protein QYF36_018801 [Acer negundo]|nr:hypothetical protein QYF36_018801 [Acer negundo]
MEGYIMEFVLKRDKVGHGDKHTDRQAWRDSPVKTNWNVGSSQGNLINTIYEGPLIGISNKDRRSDSRIGQWLESAANLTLLVTCPPRCGILAKRSSSVKGWDLPQDKALPI